LRRWFREPLLHFFLLGALLFAGYGLVKPRSRPTLTSRRIDISSGDVDQLAQAFEQQWRRPPTPAELRGLVGDRIHEEVLYREAIAMGLDRDDVVIRRRLAQKFQFLSEDLAETHAPTDTELERYMASHRERYVAPARLTFLQLFFNPARRGPRAQPDAARALDLLRTGRTPPPELRGDPFLLQAEFESMTPEEIDRAMGAEFGGAVARASGDIWTGPLLSSYGWHLVKVERHVEAAPPALAAVHDAVRRDWEEEQRKHFNEELYRRLRERYEVVIHPPAPGDAQASTMAPRDSSAR
jgi:hypothetical protein